MEDLYVQPEHRRKGVGLSLFQSVAQVSHSEHIRTRFIERFFSNPDID